MATIETKFSIGDLVYFASAETERKQHPCPDCNGTRKWKAISPAGGEYLFGCPRCGSRYQSNDALSLDYSTYEPRVRPLTIGQIEHNTNPSAYNAGSRYMARETGLGSGSVYNESQLFPDEEAALVAAQALAAERNATTEWVVKLYDKTLELSDYQLEHAVMQAAKRRESGAGSLLWNINDLFETIQNASDKDAILEAIEDYRSWSAERDRQELFRSDLAKAIAADAEYQPA